MDKTKFKDTIPLVAPIHLYPLCQRCAAEVLPTPNRTKPLVVSRHKGEDKAVHLVTYPLTNQETLCYLHRKVELGLIKL